MIRSGSALWLLPALASVAPAIAGATPPPPEPTAHYGANQAVCLPRFAILLGADERAQLYPGDHLAVSGARLSLGIVVHPASHAVDALRAFRRRNSLQSVAIPGIGQAQRHPIAEWPGNRNRGWAYWLPLNGGASPDYVTIAADQFVGSAADYPVLRRVLTGDARRRICPQP